MTQGRPSLAQGQQSPRWVNSSAAQGQSSGRQVSLGRLLVLDSDEAVFTLVPHK